MRETLEEDGAQLLGYGPTAGHRPLQQLLADQMRERGSSIEADGSRTTPTW